jgi:L-rhamnose mutarotase
MERACFYLRLFPGTEAEYGRRHASIWPELAEAIREAGLRNLTGFRRGTDVWYYFECDPDAETAFDKLAAEPANQRWNEHFGTLIAETATADGERQWYREIFHANGGGDGPMQRGLLTLVVDPERVEEYDARHADPWPEMMEAIDQAGIHNYTGFRRGSHVVYYGEYHPDMETAFGRIGETEINRRWGESFTGIITTIVDEAGRLITAQEVFHQD